MQFFLHVVYLSIERALVFLRLSYVYFLVQTCTGERPCSLWQSSTLLWDEACSRSTWQENNESGREGKGAALQWWQQAESQICNIFLTTLNPSGYEKSHQQEHRHAGVLSTTVSTWNHRSSWGNFQGQERFVVVVTFLTPSDLQIYFYLFFSPLLCAPAGCALQHPTARGCLFRRVPHRLHGQGRLPTGSLWLQVKRCYQHFSRHPQGKEWLGWANLVSRACFFVVHGFNPCVLFCFFSYLLSSMGTHQKVPQWSSTAIKSTGTTSFS